MHRRQEAVLNWEVWEPAGPNGVTSGRQGSNKVETGRKAQDVLGQMTLAFGRCLISRGNPSRVRKPSIPNG